MISISPSYYFKKILFSERCVLTSLVCLGVSAVVWQPDTMQISWLKIWMKVYSRKIILRTDKLFIWTSQTGLFLFLLNFLNMEKPISHFLFCFIPESGTISLYEHFWVLFNLSQPKRPGYYGHVSLKSTFQKIFEEVNNGQQNLQLQTSNEFMLLFWIYIHKYPNTNDNIRRYSQVQMG